MVKLHWNKNALVESSAELHKVSVLLSRSKTAPVGFVGELPEGDRLD